MELKFRKAYVCASHSSSRCAWTWYWYIQFILGHVINLADCLNQANDVKRAIDSVEGRTITLTCYLLIASKNVSARPPDIWRKIYWHFPIIYNCILRIWLSHYMNNEMLKGIILSIAMIQVPSNFLTDIYVIETVLWLQEYFMLYLYLVTKVRLKNKKHNQIIEIEVYKWQFLHL